MESKYVVDTIQLKKIMVEQNLDTIIELSNESGIDRNTLSKIINGDVRPSTLAMERLILALKIPTDDAGKIFFSQNLRNA